MRSPWHRSRSAGLLLVGAAVALYGLLVHNPYFLNLAVLIAINGLAALGLGLLMGGAGQISLGHAGFYGLGAYASALLTTRFHLNPWLALVLGAALTGLIAFLVGKPTLRLRGHYLAMGTLGLGLIIWTVFNQAAAWTEGPSGITGIPPLALGRFALDTDLRFYWLAWPVVLLAVLLAGNLLDSRMGRALRALGENEGAASATGVDVPAAKLDIFILSAVYASVAGSLYAHYVAFVNPSPFGFSLSIQLLVMVVIGGAQTVWGPLAGAAVLTVLHQVLSAAAQHFPKLEGVEVVAYGAALVLFLLFRPQGLITPSRRRATIGSPSEPPPLQGEGARGGERP
jgi:branched-chain amino acid transport system permease protein